MSFFYEISELKEIPVVSGVTMKTLYTEESSFAFVDFPPMSQVQTHHHDSEQVGIDLEGEIEYTVGEEKKMCRKGMMIVIPPNTPHSAMVTSDKPAKVLDVFTPMRELHHPLNYVK